QLIKKDALLSSGGERVQVLYPGRENDDSGPDFCDALIVIGGMTLKGDVELHVSSREWQNHGHHKDHSYNGVILHVVMWDDGNETSLLHSGKMVPILALYPYLLGSLEELSRAVQIPLPSDEPCHMALEQYGREALAELLDKAGEERFYSKVEQFKAKLAAQEAGQVLYEGLMRALGYAKNKEPSEELARRLPLGVLAEFAQRSDIHTLQALMLGTAGLLPRQRCRKEGGEHSSDGDELEVVRLERIWESFGIMPGTDGLGWRFFRVRPENFPTRRIVGASYLLSRYGGVLGGILSLISQAPRREVQKDWERGLMVRVDGYWANHFDFGLESRWNPSLIGQGRAREIVVNVLLPFSFAWAAEFLQPWLREQAIELYRSYPRLGENWVTRYMERQIFREHGTKLIDSACRQQGLIHLYKNFCVERRCPECPLGITSSA
ncbi:MAG TPA: DUF2851 family protein, partial [Dehalococcoidia bacterium]|nr:DUF2851 family protein [Dehalococcoidia bacterium]